MTRLLRLGALCFAVVGLMFLIVGYGREHRDLARLYLIAIGWLAVAGAAMLIVGSVIGRGRRDDHAPRPP